jgi:hypothetical protein
VGILETLGAKLGISAARRSASQARDRWKRGGVGMEEDRHWLLDFATGLGQATMAQRDAVAHYERYPVAVDPDYGTLTEGQAELLDEAERTLNEAEARLPRVQVIAGVDSAAGSSAREAVAALRESFDKLIAYVRQPGEGEDWSYANRDAARAVLTEAETARDRFLRAVGR